MELKNKNRNIHFSNKSAKTFRDKILNSVSLDLEWTAYQGKYEHRKTQIYAAAFCTFNGKRVVLHISNYKHLEKQHREKALIKDILLYFNQFALSFGWYTTGVVVYDVNGNRITGRDSDFFILHQRCMFYNLESPFELGYNGRYITLRKGSENRHIDLVKIFEKEIIKDNVFGGRYKTASLKSVSSSLLGLTKYDDIDAGLVNVLEKTIEEQKRYVKRDAELAMLLAQYRNCLVLRLMESFSKYAEMDYYTVCHVPISKWYANKYKKMIERMEVSTDYTPNYRLQIQDIGGGHHTTPKKGFFVNVKIYELDVKGMYPSIVAKENLSFDTLNCTCCRYEQTAQINQDTIDIINQDLQKKKTNRRVERYWVCKKRKGAFPLLLEKVQLNRDRYLQLLKQEKAKPNPSQLLIEEYETQQLAAKLFGNSGFGLFKNEYFEFSNYEVAECITGEGRRIHKQMELMARQEPFNFDIVFGFTDSIFVKVNEKNGIRESEDKIQQFIAKCKEELGITVELKNVFVNSILYGKKNRFVGWTGKETVEPIIKGLDGLKYSNPLWIRNWVYKIISEIIRKPYSISKTVPKLLNEAIFELENVICKSTDSIRKELKFTPKLTKNPNDYKVKSRIAISGKMLEKDKGEQTCWYETINNDEQTKDNYSITAPTPKNINLQKYKSILFDKLKDTLEITDFDILQIRSEMMNETAKINSIDQKE